MYYKQAVEDEYHFILECEKHKLIREEYLKYYRKRPSCFKLVQLLSSQNIKELNNLGKYLCISEKLRNYTFYFVYYNLSYICISPSAVVIYSVCNLCIYIYIDIGAFKIVVYIVLYKLYCF